jgi:hypothetical protein
MRTSAERPPSADSCVLPPSHGRSANRDQSDSDWLDLNLASWQSFLFLLYPNSETELRAGSDTVRCRECAARFPHRKFATYFAFFKDEQQSRAIFPNAFSVSNKIVAKANT